jgi:hypothetical protein
MPLKNLAFQAVLVPAFMLLIFSSSSYAEWRQCTEAAEPQFEFIRAIGAAATSRSEAITTLSISCRDDDSNREDIFTNNSRLLQTLNNGFVHGVLGFIGMGWGDSTGLRSDEPYIIKYDAALGKIKANPDRYQRIRSAYELAIANQGAYAEGIQQALETSADEMDKNNITQASTASFALTIVKGIWYEIKSSPNPLRALFDVFDVRPTRVLVKAHETGIGGICRHFATLLYYNLMQTARTYGDTDMYLGNTAFSPDIVGSLDHVWIRVNVSHPNPNGVGLSFSTFDLDPTIYHDRFMPIYTRNNWDAAGAKLAAKKCQEVTWCLLSKRD